MLFALLCASAVNADTHTHPRSLDRAAEEDEKTPAPAALTKEEKALVNVDFSRFFGLDTAGAVRLFTAPSETLTPEERKQQRVLQESPVAPTLRRLAALRSARHAATATTAANAIAAAASSAMKPEKAKQDAKAKAEADKKLTPRQMRIAERRQQKLDKEKKLQEERTRRLQSLRQGKATVLVGAGPPGRRPARRATHDGTGINLDKGATGPTGTTTSTLAPALAAVANTGTMTGTIADTGAGSAGKEAAAASPEAIHDLGMAALLPVPPVSVHPPRIESVSGVALERGRVVEVAPASGEKPELTHHVEPMEAEAAGTRAGAVNATVVHPSAIPVPDTLTGEMPRVVEADTSINDNGTKSADGSEADKKDEELRSGVRPEDAAVRVGLTLRDMERRRAAVEEGKLLDRMSAEEFQQDIQRRLAELRTRARARGDDIDDDDDDDDALKNKDNADTLYIRVVAPAQPGVDPRTQLAELTALLGGIEEMIRSQDRQRGEAGGTMGGTVDLAAIPDTASTNIEIPPART